LNTKHSGRAARTRGGAHADAAEVVRTLRRLFKAVHEYSKAIHRKTGLSGPQVWALNILETNPGLSLGELAARMFAHASTVSGVVDRLVERKAVRREVDRDDRRGVRLTLTATGRRLQRSSPPPVQVGLRRALEAMPAGRLRRLRQSLEEIARQTEIDRFDAPFFDGEG
jgi:DNA-binding MarR family transcriptional regulator